MTSQATPILKEASCSRVARGILHGGSPGHWDQGPAAYHVGCCRTASLGLIVCAHSLLSPHTSLDQVVRLGVHLTHTGPHLVGRERWDHLFRKQENAGVDCPGLGASLRGFTPQQSDFTSRVSPPNLSSGDSLMEVTGRSRQGQV